MRAVGHALTKPLSRRAAYVFVAGMAGLALFSSGTPSPLYGVYASLWHFSPLVLTLVYATYAFGVLTTLIVAGRVSDQVGRRPVLLVAILLLIVATVPFMLASSIAWLFVARALQGLATGLALSAASASLLDLHSRRDPVAVGLTNGVASTTGMGLGVLASSAIVQWLPAPRVLPYVMLLVLFLIALVCALRMPEPAPVQGRRRVRLTVQRPRISPQVRRPFLLAALAVISSWSIGGLFLSLGPELSSIVLKSSSPLTGGLLIFLLAGSGSLSQLLLGRSAPWRGTATGSIALAVGMGLVVLAATDGSAPALIVGAIVGGAGFGVAFLGGLRALSAAIPDEHRAEVMSAFYVVAYLALSLPAVLAGVLIGSLGVTRTFEIFGGAVAVLALVVASEAWRTRPRRPGQDLTVAAAMERPAVPMP